jgi:hypothetical protein
MEKQLTQAMEALEIVSFQFKAGGQARGQVLYIEDDSFYLFINEEGFARSYWYYFDEVKSFQRP